MVVAVAGGDESRRGAHRLLCGSVPCSVALNGRSRLCGCTSLSTPVTKQITTALILILISSFTSFKLSLLSHPNRIVREEERARGRNEDIVKFLEGLKKFKHNIEDLESKVLSHVR